MNGISAVCMVTCDQASLFLRKEQGRLDRRLSVWLTNRFHVAVRLFYNRSQMTYKKVAHEGIAECVIDVLTTF